MPISITSQPSRSDHGSQHRTVAVVNGAVVQFHACWTQFIACGEQGNADTAAHRHFGHTQRGKQANMGRTQHGAFSQGDRTGGQIFPGTTDVVATDSGFRRDGQMGFIEQFDVFLLDYGIAALRNHRAGHDANAFAETDPGGIGMACVGITGHFQGHGLGEVEVFAGKGIAVHCRVVEGGNGKGRDNVFGQNASQTVFQDNPFDGADRRNKTVNKVVRQSDRQGIGIVGREATGQFVKDRSVLGHERFSGWGEAGWYFSRSTGVLMFSNA